MKSKHPDRRHFLKQSLGLLAAAGVAPQVRAADNGFSFVFLGDLHFDKLEHHDMGWLEKNKKGDLSQINNYTRITRDITPRLFDAVDGTLSELRHSDAPPAFVLQAGDLVEGLCGTAELSATQNREAIAFIKARQWGLPFLFTKGNHDVTGDGAKDAFREVFGPFLAEQSKGKAMTGLATQDGCYATQEGNAQFFFLDAYEKPSLEWLEAALAKRTADHAFVIVHPPVVPYGARATWYLFASDKDKAKREKFLGLLGKQNAFVLGGHIHRFNTLTRVTPNGGRFVQMALSSVVGKEDLKASMERDGLSSYNGDQIEVEPSYSPETAQARRAVYTAEAPSVKSFNYADLPGHAAITVRGASVTATIYGATGRTPWKTVDLTKLMSA